MNFLRYKNILVTLLRDKTGRHLSGFPKEDDFILELTEQGYSILSDQEIIDSTEKKLRRAADHVLHSQSMRERCGQTGRFTWDDFAASVTNEMLSPFGLRRFEQEELIARHVAVAVDREENLMPDLSDGHVYLCKGKRRQRLVATVSVDMRSGALTGDFDVPIDPGAQYVLAFRDHDELVPLSHGVSASGVPCLVLAESGEFLTKAEET